MYDKLRQTRLRASRNKTAGMSPFRKTIFFSFFFHFHLFKAKTNSFSVLARHTVLFSEPIHHPITVKHIRQINILISWNCASTPSHSSKNIGHPPDKSMTSPASLGQTLACVLIITTLPSGRQTHGRVTATPSNVGFHDHHIPKGRPLLQGYVCSGQGSSLQGSRGLLLLLYEDREPFHPGTRPYKNTSLR